jgi:uncharacterized delta-60 repeat protein
MRVRPLGGLCAAALALGASAAGAWAAGLDPSYGAPDGYAATPLSTTADRFHATALGPNGGVYAVGYTTSPSARTDQQFALARILSNGTLDSSFGTGGVASINVKTGGTGEIATGVVVQTKGANAGKIVVAGQAEGVDDSADTDLYVVRFNVNGTPDTTFGDTPGSAVRVLDLSPGRVPSPTAPPAVVRSPDSTWGLLKQDDDKLVLVAARGNGEPGTPNANRTDRDLGAVRLNADGSRDTTFGTNGVVMVGAVFDEDGQSVNAAETPRGGVIEPGGKIVVSGYASVNGRNRPLLLRINGNGTPDASFGSVGGAPGLTTAELGPTASVEIHGVALQGRNYVTTGLGSQTASSSTDLVSLRFRANGSLDTTYGTSGFVWFDGGQGEDDGGRSLVVLPNQRIFIAGSTAALAGATVQHDALGLLLTSNGQRDSSFGSSGVIEVDLGGAADAFVGLTLLPTGRVVAAGFKGGTTVATDDAATARFDAGFVPTAPVATIAALTHNATLTRGPIRLTGRVTPAEGVSRVVLKLTQGKGAACRAYLPAKLTFSGRSCPRSRGFTASYSNGRWAFELANRLPRGTYQLDAVAYSNAGKAQPIKLGKNRIRFTVAP